MGETIRVGVHGAVRLQRELAEEQVARRREDGRAQPCVEWRMGVLGERALDRLDERRAVLRLRERVGHRRIIARRARARAPKRDEALLAAPAHVRRVRSRLVSARRRPNAPLGHSLGVKRTSIST